MVTHLRFSGPLKNWLGTMSVPTLHLSLSVRKTLPNTKCFPFFKKSILLLYINEINKGRKGKNKESTRHLRQLNKDANMKGRGQNKSYNQKL